MEPITITSNLVKKDGKEGIITYENEETKLLYFSDLPFWCNPKDVENIISCPDKRSAFDKIDVYKHIVVCRLPIHTTDDIEVFRVYLREKGEWLTNPDIKKALEDFPAQGIVGKKEDEPINFGPVIDTSREYIHINTMDNKGMVYVFGYAKWIEVPHWTLWINSPLKHFTKVALVNFTDRPCLLLTHENDKNPFSVFFLDRGEYFYTTTIPGMKDREQGCCVFNQIFSKYVVVGMGGGTDSRSDYFHIWRIKNNDYFSVKIDGQNELEFNKFRYDLFTEKHIAVHVNRLYPDQDPSFEIISTETWYPIEVEFQYNIKRKDVINPSILEGKIIVSTPCPAISIKTSL